MPDGDISATAEGANEIVDRIVVLKRIDVRYTIRLPEGADREKADRALATHVDKCPTAQSIRDAVEIAWTAEVVDG